MATVVGFLQNWSSENPIRLSTALYSGTATLPLKSLFPHPLTSTEVLAYFYQKHGGMELPRLASQSGPPTHLEIFHALKKPRRWDSMRKGTQLLQPPAITAEALMNPLRATWLRGSTCWLQSHQ